MTPSELPPLEEWLDDEERHTKPISVIKRDGEIVDVICVDPEAHKIAMERDKEGLLRRFREIAESGHGLAEGETLELVIDDE